MLAWGSGGDGLSYGGNSFRLLGPLEVIVAGRVVDIPAHKHRTLIAGLLLDAGRAASYRQLAYWVWDESPPANPKAALYTYVRRVRQRLGDSGLLSTTPNGYRMDVSPEDVDLFRFRDLVARAAAVTDLAEQVRLLRLALSEWNGTPLENIGSSTLRQEFQDLLLEEKHDAQERLFHAELARGGGAPLVAELRAATAAHPLREKLWQLLMLAFYRAGRRAEALAAYQQVRDLLVTELGVEPGHALSRLQGQILAADPDLAGSPADGGGSRPVEVAAVTVPAQLPPEPPSLVGRRALADRAGSSLPASDERTGLSVLVFTGAPGIGKTALALHIGHRVRDNYPDGQLYLDLGGYGKDEPMTPERALQHLLIGLGVAAGQIPLDLRDQVGLYRSWLARKRVLVVLDNASEKYDIDFLLPGAPGCAVIITSRDRFHRLIVAYGAQVVPVDTLDAAASVDLLTGILANGSVEVDQPVLEEIGELCGHLPLALRIAAANLVIRPTSEHPSYVDELRRGNRLAALSLGDGGETAVSAAFCLSYQALRHEDQRIFRHLGFLPGRDFSAAAVAALTGVDPRRAASALNRLISASLVERAAGDRYQVHDLLRHYAGDLVARGGDGERQALGRLGTWYLQLSDRAAALLHAEFVRMPLPGELGVPAAADFVDARAALAWLNAERSNLIALALRSAQSGPNQVAWHLADVLRGYFWTGKYRAEWREVTLAALQAATAAGEDRAIAAMHRSLGNLYNLSGDYRLSLEHQNECLRRHRPLGMAEAEMAALINIGHTNLNLARPDAVRRYSREALDIAQRIGSDRGKATARVLLGSAARLVGARPEALGHFEQALAIATELGLQHVKASSMCGLGFVYREIGETEAAQRYFGRVLHESESLGSSYDRSNALYGMALTHSDLGDSAAALACACQARDSFRKAGERTHEVNTLCLMSRILLGDDRRPEALDCAHEARTLAEQLDYPRGLAELAEFYAEVGHPPTAFRSTERAPVLDGR